MALPEPLRFTIGLIDQISRPLANIRRGLDDLTTQYRAGVDDMMTGATGLAGAGIALYASLQPAIEFDSALANLRSLDVTDEALKKVTKTAFDFSNEFGVSAVEVVNTAEQIRLVMGDLPTDVLNSVTRASATLTKSMKSDTETTTRFIKNLYGNYQQEANSIGVDVWANRIAGMTAQARKSFGLSLNVLEGGIEGMHSLTSTLGVSFSEQLAVFGLLVKQMGEGDATTQYTNFLEGAVGAQEKLGVSLTDTYGNLLPMTEILERIKPLIEGLSGADARFKLDEAGLGDGSLLLINLLERSDELKQSLNALENVKGLDVATEMAEKMTSPFQQLQQSINNVRKAFGAVLLPALLPIVRYFAEGAAEIINFTQQFPNITRYIGYAALAVIAFTALNGLMTISMGIGRQAMASWGIVKKAFTGLVSGLTRSLAFLNAVVRAVNVAIAANPMILVVAAVVSAIAVIGALIYYWDDLKASFCDTAWFQAITILTAPFRALFEFIMGGWTLVTSGFSDFSGFAGLFEIVDEVKDIFSNMFGWISDKFSGIFDSLKSVGGWFGFGHDDNQTANQVEAVRQSQPANRVYNGGISRQYTSYNQSRSTNYGGVSIYTQQMNSPYDLANELEIAAP